MNKAYQRASEILVDALCLVLAYGDFERWSQANALRTEITGGDKISGIGGLMLAQAVTRQAEQELAHERR